MALDAGSLNVVLLPLISILVVGGLALVLRWTFGDSRPVRSLEQPGDDADYGLLAEVATVPTRADGHALRAVLSDAGIRSTMTVGPDGRAHVLVFRTELDRALQVVGPH